MPGWFLPPALLSMRAPKPGVSSSLLCAAQHNAMNYMQSSNIFGKQVTPAFVVIVPDTKHQEVRAL